MKPRVFIGSSVQHEDIAYALQEELQHDATVKVWPQGIFEAGSNALDDLIKATGDFDFGIFIFAPEDKITVKQTQALTVRDNVLFELGLFLGKLGKERNFYLIPAESSKSHVASDLEGVTPLKFQMPDSTDDLQSALGPAANQVRKRMKKLGLVEGRSREEGKIVFDSNKGSSVHDIVGSGQKIYKDDKAVTERADGRL